MQNDPYVPPKAQINGETSSSSSSLAAGKMEITYTNSLVDLVRNNVGSTFRNPVLAVLLCLLALWTSYANSLDTFGNFHFRQFLPSLIWMIFVFFVCMTIVSLLTYGYALLGRSREAVVGPHRIEISDEGITEETSTQRTTIRWHGVHRVGATGAFIRIYLSPLNLYLIPRSAFLSWQDSDAFLKIARQFFEGAKKRKT